MRRFPPRRRRRAGFGDIVVKLAILTFVLLYSATDWGGVARPVQSLVRERPAVAVAAPFANCTEAREAGADPVYLHDPGYGEHLDGDLDGIGCEPYP